jgi:hypothetical protein
LRIEDRGYRIDSAEQLSVHPFEKNGGEVEIIANFPFVLSLVEALPDI